MGSIDFESIFQYYTTSTIWDKQVTSLLDQAEQLYPSSGSAVRQRWDEEMEEWGNDFSARIQFTQAEFQLLFRANISERRRFAVVFGRWWGLDMDFLLPLSEDQILPQLIDHLVYETKKKNKISS